MDEDYVLQCSLHTSRHAIIYAKVCVEALFPRQYVVVAICRKLLLSRAK